MTQVAEPGSRPADAPAPGRVSHWIGGAIGRRHVRPARARSTIRPPAPSREDVDFASAEEVDAAVAAAKAAFPAWRATSLSKRTEIMFQIRNLVEHAPPRAGGPAHRRARQGPIRRARRDRPWPREPRVRVRHPAPAQGRLHRAGLDRRRRLPDPPAARRRGRDHAVQLPGDGPDVDVRRPRSRAATRSSSSRRRRTRRRRSSSPSCSPRPACPDGVFNVVQGDKVAVDAILEHPDIAAVSASSARRRSRATSTRPARAHGKRVQALGGAKNHMVVLPDADIDMAADAAVSAGYGSAGERCMAIATVVAVGDVADPLVEAIRRAAAEDQGRAGHRPDAEMGPLVTQQHRDKVASLPRQRPGPGRDGRRRRPRAPALQGVGRLLPRRLADRRRDARDGLLPRRDLRPGPDGRPRRDVRRGGQRSSTTTRTATARRSSPATAARRASSSSRSTPGWSASTCRSRCRSPTTASAAGRRRCSATCTCTAPRASSSYTARAKSRHEPLRPDPGTSSKVDLGFPRTR